MKQKNSSGQALLIVLLSMAVVLTIVLSVLARSITDISISSQDEDSLRAFSAAEAGVERALIIGSGITSTDIGNASYSVNVSSVAEGQKEFNYPLPLFSVESMNLWFVSHDENGDFICSSDKPCFTGQKMKICWGRGDLSSDQDIPAIEVSIYYALNPGVYSSIQIAREVIDPDTARVSGNYFSSPDEGTCDISGVSYKFQKTIDFSSLLIPSGSYLVQNGLQFAMVKLFYNNNQSHPVGFDFNFPGNSAIPAQANKIESSGFSGDTNRKIEVFRILPSIPSIFNSTIFTLNDLYKSY